MFFTRIGTFLAYLVFGLGVIRTCIGFYIAISAENMDSNVFLAERYFAASNSGEVINTGVNYIGVAVFLGILCEISKSRKNNI